MHHLETSTTKSHDAVSDPTIIEGLIVLVLTLFVFGLVFMLLYRWIIAPIFGIAPLTHGQAIAVGFVVRYVTLNKFEQTEENIWIAFFRNMVTQGTIVIIGFVLSFCI